MKHKTTKTIVGNVGVVSKEVVTYLGMTREDVSPVLRLCRQPELNQYFFSVAGSWNNLVKIKSTDN